MTENTITSSRLHRSARALKAFIEYKLKVPLVLLGRAPERTLPDDLAFGDALIRHGLWGLRPERPLTESERREVRDSIEAVLENLTSLDAKADGLRRLQAKMELALEEIPSNVIPMRKPTAPQPAFSSIHDKRWMLRIDCLIESPDEAEILKMALELHGQSRRQAFLNFGEIDGAARTSADELLAMGNITLLVPSLTRLTAQEQWALYHLTEVDSLNRPLLMVGTQMPYADLRAYPGVHLDLLANLSRAYIKLSRPVSEYREKGLIQYFLDSLSESPT